MKIRKLHLKNIGVFEDEPIDFKPCPEGKAEIHILTGENGTGKTTILQALANSIKSDSITLWDKLILGEDQTFLKRLRQGCDLNLIPDLDNYEPLKYFRYIYDRVSKDNKLTMPVNRFSFAAFAYSGYRQIKDEPIEIGKEIDENPLYEALDFIKDENSKFNVNQWLGQNLINSSLEQTKNKLEEAEYFKKKVQTLESVVNDIILKETKDNEIRFEMQSATKLVLIKNEQELDFDVLPDGLKSLISWIGDLLMRLDSLKWENDTPIFDREIILFLDEIEVHLHPAWQRKVLPIVQKLFKNAQIFVSTHSPFVVNSVDDAWVYKLKVKDGKAKVESVTKSEDGNSYSYVLEETFDIKEEFGVGVQKDLDKFKDLRNQILSSTNGTSKFEKDIKALGRKLAEQSEELNTIVQFEIRQINRRKGTKLTI